MQTIYIAECKGHYIKMSDDLDCLPCEAIRVVTHLLPTDADVFRQGFEYQRRRMYLCLPQHWMQPPR
jgi:hypothetical protein